MQTCIRIHPKDSVAVALQPLKAGTWICASDPGRSDKAEGEPGFLLKEDIPAGHKFALQDIPKGTPVIKYGEPIGIAGEDIPQGAHVHTHNLKTALDGVLTYTYHPTGASVAATKEAYFQGYRRSDKKAGVRNELWIIPTVGCVNDVASAIAERAQDLVSGSIDAVVAFSHPYGCSQMGEDQENTRRILADLIRHPNAGGVLVLGLGCENSNISELKKYIGDYDPERIRFLVAQECEDEIAEGLSVMRSLAEYAGKAEREPISCSELVVGLKCGGSDGLSGITANPTVGGFSDLLISKGGTTILTEVPEMFGAETLLMNRCENEALFEQTVKLINDFKNYFTSHGQSIYENPSPGNKKGGISTLEDKSLGCTQKSGSAPVEGVLSYGEPVKSHGLNLLSAPGNDLVASTALAASGAQIVLFTTGRGTPFASPVPTVKISSNTPLYEKKKNWIDFNCGTLLEGVALSELSGQLFDHVLRIASGEPVKSETAGFHDMAIFKQGVTL
ncbi:MAG TPA: altronate dehydratase family protein [Candidatus Eisenbergiella merdipullorum]|uniref:Altronate dehydratase family protein n=1 Tax=Candidatus Eisenbergiella merdipullorum TaxID=2838553 RepID=A0A9D2KYW2_9FIRM|nr:altronate dehydratase family protein [Candidatus Eisenbergiella merdipullorum]